MGWFWTSVLVLGIGLVVGGLFSRALVGCGAFTEKAGRMLFAFVMLFVVSFLGAVWLFTSVFDPSQDIFVLVGIVLVFTLFATLFGIVLGKANIKDKERIAKEREDDPSLVLSPEEQGGTATFPAALGEGPPRRGGACRRLLRLAGPWALAGLRRGSGEAVHLGS